MTENYLTGDIDRLAFGGQGITRVDQLVVFIPFTAPGDRVQYQIAQKKKRFAFGKLLEVIRDGPERVNPPCPYFTTCGGCQLQHLSYQEQLKWKRQWIQDALIKQGKFDHITVPEVTAAHQQWDYRRRISLTLKPLNGNFTSGYTAVDHKSLVSVDQCPIFVTPDNPILKEVQMLAQELITDCRTEAKVSILKRNQGSYLLHFHFKTMPVNIRKVLTKASQANPHWTGILASSPKESFSIGQLETEIQIEGLTFRASPKAFIQNHPEQSLNIIHSLCKQAEKISPNTVLDLYCGIGVSSLMLARLGLPVTGVEMNQEAVRLAKANAEINHINTVDFIQGDVQQLLKKLLHKSHPDLVIVNPPREGLSPEVVQTLIQNPPQWLVYISCMPQTLARDLKFLAQSTYKISSVEAYDMFPQTTHVETVVWCRRN